MQYPDDVHHYSDSALWLVTQEPVLNEFVCYLKEKKDCFLRDGLNGQELVFSRRQLEDVRLAFDRMICKGEEKLHRLCGLLSEDLFQTHLQLKSVVIAQLPGSRQRLKLLQDIDKSDIYLRTDLDLGNWLLEKLRYQGPHGWEKPKLLANFVEYQPLQRNPFAINKIISRIKAEEEIWSKVVDEIFELDKLVTQDKQLRELSYFIKDVFGIKIVVDSVEHVLPVFEFLNSVAWSSETLAQHGVSFEDSTRRLELLEMKNHLGAPEQKDSGWQAIKMVYLWWQKTFEIQVQTLDVFLREQERLTQESHAAFKEKRERIRQQVADQLPLFGLYLKLLKWLFIHPNEQPPKLDGIRVVMRDH
ncbi:MAG: hypothetical protein ACOVS5_03820 [Oligoflexus sp.]